MAGFNGWNNYETWVANLWLNSTEATYFHFRNAAARITSDIAANGPSRPSWSADQDAVHRMSIEISNWITAEWPVELPGMWAELLRAAVEKVNTMEIAAGMLEDFLPINPANEGGE